MNNNLTYLGVFAIDEKDNPAELTAELEAKNNEFEEKMIRPKIRMLDDLSCRCCGASNHKFNPTGTVATMDASGEITEKDASEIKTNDIVLEPIGSEEDHSGKDSVYEYTAVVRSVDNEYKESICVIRRCTKCGDIMINGDLDEITKVIGMGVMNNIDYETKCAEAEHPEEDCENCDCGCSGSCQCCDNSDSDCTADDNDN